MVGFVIWLSIDGPCSKILELEEELKVVGNNMKSLEISEQEVSTWCDQSLFVFSSPKHEKYFINIPDSVLSPQTNTFEFIIICNKVTKHDNSRL